MVSSNLLTAYLVLYPTSNMRVASVRYFTTNQWITSLRALLPGAMLYITITAMVAAYKNQHLKPIRNK
jgi:hypothetical protein